MKNWDLSKWPPIGRGLLTGSRSEQSPGRGEGRGRELGCNSHNHPSVNDLQPPLIVAHDTRGGPNPTGRPPPGLLGSAAGSAFGVRPNSVMGLGSPPLEPNKLLPPHHLGALRTKHSPAVPPRSAPASPVPSPTAGEKGLGADTPSRRTHWFPPPTN